MARAESFHILPPQLGAHAQICLAKVQEPPEFQAVVAAKAEVFERHQQWKVGVLLNTSGFPLGAKLLLQSMKDL